VIKGYVMLGLNPRRGLDTDHEQFISDLAKQMRELMTRVTTEAQTLKRERYLMEELTYSERRISNMAEVAPVGIFNLGADGSMLWANSYFYNIFGIADDRHDPALFNWRDHFLHEDLAEADSQVARSLAEKVQVSGSLRIRRRWRPPETAHDPKPKDEPYWIMYTSMPDIKADGSVPSMMGYITDISHLKWAEQLQARNALAAEREKRRHEEFIDITSHEMRNPLSAITQCADSIAGSIHDVEVKSDVRSLVEIIKLNAEAAESILFCAAHQRRIIDDVLTLGKLNSELLNVAPTAFHPRTLVNEAFQMFKAEIEANGIELKTSFDSHSILTPVYGDAARLMQVLVNLLTNAIKFTKAEKTRTITIRFGSSRTPPATNLFGPNFHWHQTKKSRPDLTQEADYGQGEAVYLYYGVVDSGRGIPDKYSDKVFSKFEQADRRTHTKYGGSGLGLFISRELAEIQGGHIGVESREAVGSTFAFFSKARCSQEQPPAHTDQQSSQTAPQETTCKLAALRLPKTSPQGPTSRSLQPSPLGTANHNILLVEDNLLNQKVLAKQLKKAGCLVQVADHGGEAIDHILHLYDQATEYGTNTLGELLRRIDCILMDWEMPVCDGLTATKRVREIEAQQGIAQRPIIGITANARPEQISKAIEAGMDRVVTKPFRVPDLLKIIDEMVELKQSERGNT